jgi:hypothetical protein
MKFGLDGPQIKSDCLSHRARNLHLANRAATVPRRLSYTAVDDGGFSNSWRNREAVLHGPILSSYRTLPKAYTVTSVLSIWLAQIRLNHGRGGMEAKRGLGWHSASSPKNSIRDSQSYIGNGNESRLPHVERRMQARIQILEVRLAGRK